MCAGETCPSFFLPPVRKMLTGNLWCLAQWQRRLLDCGPHPTIPFSFPRFWYLALRLGYYTVPGSCRWLWPGIVRGLMVCFCWPQFSAWTCSPLTMRRNNMFPVLCFASQGAAPLEGGWSFGCMSSIAGFKPPILSLLQTEGNILGVSTFASVPK